ncbi:CCA tRNA nucleotidyltransferase [Oenococcus oeni]|uniref:CCA tRNA nucleotidyltransferase n=1 Tax=Oenococcus oeni TaxID=1247 RepID=UPI000277B87A|nr:CCA tRNA nucleotidyltransferase [Oenococcus oeni]EJO01747.1 tRNA nucleotidyltransferase/poly(A) polymerase [Oenococcus oeni AWRIB418]KGH62899.1 tRNA nucleotidyltransferase [Oenococcus oeni S13]OIM39974.1 tRNA nucleotidyltransferase [Oenococcus oeni]QGR01416.1 CCA tRNA nucleotidyltransferase [Oenococcus oeni]TEU23630.1 CCA tRNA nucleotidyltransferase [Oenococcus oeni]
MIIELTNEFKEAIPVLNCLENHGYQAYFVGGSVRDAILRRPIHDVDITTDALPNEMKRIFKTADNYAGEKHGTDLVFLNGKKYEVTTFRIDGKYLDNRHPKNVSFTKNLKEDLSRRDFTINAFAMNQEGELFDYFSGLDDLKKKIIRTVGDAKQRFSEDALRILRAFRFSSQLDFKIEEETLRASQMIKENLNDIAIERIFVEFSKLLAGKNPQRSLRQMYDLGIVDFLPGQELITDQSDLFSNYIGIQSSSDAINWTRFIFFSNLRESSLTKYLGSWKMSNQLKKQIFKSINLLEKDKPSKLDLFDAGLEISIALSAIKRDDRDNLLSDYENLAIHDLSELDINGIDLKNIGIPVGPIYGKIIEDLKEKVILGKINNNKQRLLKEAKDDYINMGTIKK